MTKLTSLVLLIVSLTALILLEVETKLLSHLQTMWLEEVEQATQISSLRVQWYKRAAYRQELLSINRTRGAVLVQMLTPNYLGQNRIQTLEEIWEAILLWVITPTSNKKRIMIQSQECSRLRSMPQLVFKADSLQLTNPRSAENTILYSKAKQWLWNQWGQWQQLASWRWATDRPSTTSQTSV